MAPFFVIGIVKKVILNQLQIHFFGTVVSAKSDVKKTKQKKKTSHNIGEKVSQV